jgi:PAS domain S-box-containing protein
MDELSGKGSHWLNQPLSELGVGVIVTDELGFITFINAMAATLTGWTGSDAQSEPLSEVFNAVNRQTGLPMRDLLSNIIELGRAIRFPEQTILVAKDGAIHPIEGSGAPIEKESNFPIGVVFFFQSAMGNKVRRNLLRQRQKLESIGVLSACLAHEINNPLTGIMNFAELIRPSLDEKSPLSEYAKGIHEECKRISSIAGNLLAFARQEDEATQKNAMADILEASLLLTRSVLLKCGITILLDVPDNLPKITCRAQQIQQVLMNLLHNARDGIQQRYPDGDENNTIHVRVTQLKKDGATWLRTTVEDNGAGIGEDVVNHIFEPFFTTKPVGHGTGLGLYVSHGIVEDHGGKLWVETETNQYTRFHLDLQV